MKTLFSNWLSFPTLLVWLLTLLLQFYAPPAEASARIKDIARMNTESETDLIGYGLVIGLDGTGDSKGVPFTRQSLANMMERMGMTIDAEQLKTKNAAAVVVTARISSNNRLDDRIDVTVSSIGDASSLQGGTLLMTPLSTVIGDMYALAQGPVSIGGFNVQVDEGNKIVNNYTLVGRVPNGAKVARELPPTGDSKDILIMLRSPDYTTAASITKKINIKYGLTAFTEDASTVRVVVPDSLSYPNERGEFIADIGQMQVTPDQAARVVINERTGTIVAGSNVSIAPVAIAHGNINVNIKSYPVISQPQPFSQGETVVTSEYQLNVDNEKARVIHFQETVSLSDVAAALNSIGAAPRDIIAIFEALKQAGALRAELVII
ncbi:MAG: flagellar biosynthesis protein FlgA [candidate division Zixibacteria bacterium HGW-Zixibacteria-1]|nr:MAG: flagellar biosynthesis protein FlgA [candidate division Zixibacteria bacterium HGW-Zixibacteria-1]